MSELTLSSNRHQQGVESTSARSPVRHTIGSLRRARRAMSRTCVGCRRADSRDDLVRFIATPDGHVAFDLVGGAFGRGAWVHPRVDCLTKSVRALGHALRQPIIQSPTEVHAALVAAAWRRTKGLLSAAKRAGHLSVGAEAATSAWRDRTLVLLLLAQDARAAARLPWIGDALVEGRVVVAPSKAMMGEWLAAEDVALAAITDPRMASAVARNMAIAQIPAPSIASRGSDKGTEVG